MENMAVHWSWQRTPGTTKENGEQNKLSNYPSQVLEVNIWANFDCNSLSMSGFWRDFIVLRMARLAVIRTIEVPKPLEQDSQSMPHIIDLI